MISVNTLDEEGNKQIHQWLPKIFVQFYIKAIFIYDFLKEVIHNAYF